MITPYIISYIVYNYKICILRTKLDQESQKIIEIGHMFTEILNTFLIIDYREISYRKYLIVNEIMIAFEI